jgi:hypothetical protein
MLQEVVMVKGTINIITIKTRKRDIIRNLQPGITLNRLKIRVLTKAWPAVLWEVYWVTKSAEVIP